MRDAVYDELPPALRARLHASVAAVLQESLEAGGEATAAEAAHHALAAARAGGDPQPAWELSLEAAREAAGAAGARRGGRALRGRARGARAGRRGQRRRCGWRRRSRSPRATFAAGDIDAARRRFRSVAAAARRSGAAEIHARAALGFSEVQQYGLIDTDAIALLQEALDAAPADDSALRARASARLGQRLDPVTDQARREALVDEGVAMARRLGDDQALVSLLAAAALVNWPPGRDAVRRAATDEVLAHAARRPGRRLLGAHDAAVATRGRRGVDVVDAELDHLARLAAESRRTYYRWCLLVLQAARATFAGRLAEGERLAEEAARSTGRHGGRRPGAHGPAPRARAAAPAPARGAAHRALRDYAARHPALPAWQAMLAQAEERLGSPRRARATGRCARDGFAAILRTPDWLCGLVLLAEPVAAWGSAGPDRAARRRARRACRRATSVMDDAWAAFGPVARPLGLLAAAAGRPEEAAAQFERAAELAARWGAPGWELAAIIATGCRAATPRGGRPPRPRAWRSRGDLELPWIAATSVRRRCRSSRARPLQVGLGGRRVAVLTPVLTPAAADEEAVRLVADERRRRA